MQRRNIVLVVDDVPGTLGLLNDTLEAAGYMVLVANSAAAAAAVIGRITPDIILMDAVMPDVDGFAACRAIKRDPALAPIPVIFMTGLTESDDVLRGFEAGGVDYVTKPIAPAEVVARVGVHLANARRTRSAQLALDVTGRYLLAADRRGHIVWTTPQAAILLGAQNARIPGWGTELPADAAPGRIASAVTAAGRALEFHYVGQIGPDELLLRLVTTDHPRDIQLLRERLGLTAREAEVLLWLGAGKSNRDIAEILELSPRTVNKHLEGIYSKIGVENRAAAAAVVVRMTGNG